MIENTITYFELDSGRRPFSEWLHLLADKKGKAIIIRRIERIQNNLFGDHKYLDEGVYELKIKYGPGYRVYYTKKNNRIIILLCGGDKSTQKRDIDASIFYVKLLKEKDNA
jgi:putative addiction module killer protein